MIFRPLLKYQLTKFMANYIINPNMKGTCLMQTNMVTKEKQCIINSKLQPLGGLTLRPSKEKQCQKLIRTVTT